MGELWHVRQTADVADLFATRTQRSAPTNRTARTLTKAKKAILAKGTVVSYRTQEGSISSIDYESESYEISLGGARYKNVPFESPDLRALEKGTGVAATSSIVSSNSQVAFKTSTLLSAPSSSPRQGFRKQRPASAQADGSVTSRTLDSGNSTPRVGGDTDTAAVLSLVGQKNLQAALRNL
jgi:hypothetical protein